MTSTSRFLTTTIPRDGTIVILTGAGISKESGLDTFRDAGGLWQRVRLEDVATPEGFAADPDLVHAFYNARRQGLQAGNVAPNAAHHALTRLENEWRGEVVIVTQNIDDLHERAGSRNLIHMHGELLQARCQRCAAVAAWTGDLSVEDSCPSCRRSGGLRPNVVWFGEMPLEMDRIGSLLTRCTLFVAIGTSGTVYPAAGFVHEVLSAGQGYTVELNLEPSEGHSLFHQVEQGAATDLVPRLVNDLLQG